MSKVVFLMIAAALWGWGGNGCWPQDHEIAVPEGMEIVEIGATRILVPKGAKVKKSGGLIILENVDEYAARRIESIESRVSALEVSLKKIDEEVKNFLSTFPQYQQVTNPGNEPPDIPTE